MEKKSIFRQYGVGIFFLGLSALILLGLLTFAKPPIWPSMFTAVYVLVIIFIFLLTIAVGLLARWPMASYLAKYIYPPVAAFILLGISYLIFFTHPDKITIGIIFSFLLFFDVLLILFVAPTILVFSSEDIKQLPTLLKFVLFVLCFAPIAYVFYDFISSISY